MRLSDTLMQLTELISSARGARSSYDLYYFIHALPFGVLVKQKIIKEQLWSIANKPGELYAKGLRLRLYIEEYVSSGEGLHEVEISLQEIVADYEEQARCGTQQGVCLVTTKPYLRNLYLLKNEALISLFKKHLVKYREFPPRAAVFLSSDNIPQSVLEHEKLIERDIKSALNRIGSQEQLIDLQRAFRRKKRKKEEKARISKVLEGQIANLYLEMFSRQHGCLPQQLLSNLDKPYRPVKCKQNIAERILRISAAIQFIKTIRHTTSRASLLSILEGCLYGARTLKEFDIAYKKAALSSFDVKNGDGNAICFGAFKIDPKARQEDPVDIELSLEKIQQRSTTAFYKQLDFCFNTYGNPLTYVQLGDLKLGIKLADGTNPKLILVIMKGDVEIIQKSIQYPHYLLIHYNIPALQQILTLNFFRFIDVCDDDEVAALIYSEIDKLTDDDLEAFLNELGRVMCLTMEFNFYGAYKINFDDVKCISTPSFRVEFDSLLLSIRKRDISYLRKAQENIPELFCSQRFLKFLKIKILAADKVSLTPGSKCRRLLNPVSLNKKFIFLCLASLVILMGSKSMLGLDVSYGAILLLSFVCLQANLVCAKDVASKDRSLFTEGLISLFSGVSSGSMEEVSLSARASL